MKNVREQGIVNSSVVMPRTIIFYNAMFGVIKVTPHVNSHKSNCRRRMGSRVCGRCLESHAPPSSVHSLLLFVFIDNKSKKMTHDLRYNAEVKGMSSRFAEHLEKQAGAITAALLKASSDLCCKLGSLIESKDLLLVIAVKYV